MHRNNQLYLHIGIHKTGTTSLQSYFWRNRNALKKIDIDYPTVGLSGHAHAGFVNSHSFPRRNAAMISLMPEFKLSNSPYGSETPQLPEKLYSELQQYVDQSGCSKFVMSSECFYEWTEPKVFAAGLGPIFDQIWIVVYLRPQIDWILSVHNQLVKDNFFKYSQGLCDLPQQTLLYYYDILQSWEDSFGESCILVRPYHTDKSFNVVTDFLELIGVKEKEGDDCYFHNILKTKASHTNTLNF